MLLGRIAIGVLCADRGVIFTAALQGRAFSDAAEKP